MNTRGSQFRQPGGLSVLLITSVLLAAQAKSTHSPAKSPTEFVEQFYRWYTPVALRENPTPAWDIALKLKRSHFSPQLARLLKEDSDAQAACEELVGLDFDPIVGSQEPAERYEVGEPIRKGQLYKVDIYAVRYGSRSEKPDVKCEFVEKGGHFLFVNFFYRDGRDLLTILKSPRPKCEAPRSSSQK
jgi:hypothetical protein